MVKSSLVSAIKKQSTTQTLGKFVAKWIIKSGCGVMILINGQLHAANIVKWNDEPVVKLDNGSIELLDNCRIYRTTVKQIKTIIGI